MIEEWRVIRIPIPKTYLSGVHACILFWLHDYSKKELPGFHDQIALFVIRWSYFDVAKRCFGIAESRYSCFVAKEHLTNPLNVVLFALFYCSRVFILLTDPVFTEIT